MQLNVKIQHLSRMAPLAVLGAEAMRILAFDGEEIVAEPGEVLFRQGERADGGYAVLSGSVALEREGDPAPPTRLMRAGSLVGVNALVVPGDRPATATVRDKAVLIRLPRRLMLRVLEAFPEAAAALKNYVEDDLASRKEALARIAEAIDAAQPRYKVSDSKTGT